MRNLIFCCTTLLIVIMSQPASAALISYSSRAMFDAAVLNMGGISDELDFDSLSPGVVASGTEINGVTFTYNLTDNASVVIDDLYETTSGTQYLGAEPDGLFIGGDSLLMSFTSRIGFGVYVISADELLDDDVTLTVDGQDTVGLVGADVVATLGDGSFVWFVGLLSDTPFTTVELNSTSDVFTFNLDNITIVATPEPATLILFPALGLAGLGVRRWQRRKAKQPAQR